MSVYVSRDVWEYSKAKGSELLVLLAIADNANGETGIAWPSVGYIAKKTRLSERQVIRQIARLEEIGELSVKRNAGVNGVNHYRVTISKEEGVTSCQPVTHDTQRGDAHDTPRVTPTSPKPLENHQEEPSSSVRTTPKWEERFNRWYSTYPRKQAKGDARKAWQKINPDDGLVAEMVAAVERQKRTHDWQKDGGKYIPLPATWLRAERWLDEVGDVAPSTPPRQPTYANSADPYEAQLLAGLEGEE